MPGAFTPGCSKTHLPGYVGKSAALKEAGAEVNMATNPCPRSCVLSLYRSVVHLYSGSPDYSFLGVRRWWRVLQSTTPLWHRPGRTPTGRVGRHVLLVSPSSLNPRMQLQRLYLKRASQFPKVQGCGPCRCMCWQTRTWS